MTTPARIVAVGILAVCVANVDVRGQPTAPAAGGAAPTLDIQLVKPPGTQSEKPGSGTALDQARMIGGPEDKLRDPFWPIGYAPATPDLGPVGPQPPSGPVTPVPTARKWDEAQHAISIKGTIRSGNRYVANINNQLVGESESVSVMFDGQKYSWKITSITAKKVLFQPMGDAPEKPAETNAIAGSAPAPAAAPRVGP